MVRYLNKHNVPGRGMAIDALMNIVPWCWSSDGH